MKNRVKRVAGDIPLASTSDIAFLLLIFFLATTVFDIESGILLDLPPSETQEKAAVLEDRSEMAVLDIVMTGSDAANDFKVKMITFASKDATIPNKRVFPIKEVGTEVKLWLERKPKSVFMVRTKPDDPYGPMVKVLDQLKMAGIQKYAIRILDEEIE
ncbi:MAG: biopolymer transporter ExbD [Candidatus Coatesbacteria bacterium]|nr:biopolymer transporter ExbD [Candidatus Coatesbacteria bacterium]